MIAKTDFSNRVAAQRFCIFLTPLLSMAICSSFRNVNIQLLKRMMHLLAALSVLLYGAAVISAGSWSGLAGWYSIAGIAMTFTLLAVSGFAGQWHAWKTTSGWLMVYYLILILTQSRMPLLIIPVILVFGYNAIAPVYKVLLAILIVLVALVAFHTEPVQQSVFHRGSGTLKDFCSFDPQVVDLSGRLNAWPQFMNGIQDRWFGDGATASAEFGYATFEGWTHPHNAYIRILFDYGYVGFVLLSVPVVVLFADLVWRARKHGKHPGRYWLFATCINGLLAMLLLGVSGNVLMYIAYIGNILFALMGCSYVISQKEEGT